ncbi:MAG TPA: MBL fold metallo-hydrolase [Catalimonadaceae bacterium]|nr:MBL fold metallo-hydrolase [Catalimonadaceae bacterium]
MLTAHTFCFNPFQENTYVLSDASGECVIIDPGCYSKSEQSELVEFVYRHNLNPVAVWLTHCHIDHILGLRFCEKEWNLPYYLSAGEIPQLKAVEVYAPNYGFYDVELPEKDGIVIHQNELLLGENKFEAFSVPGHSPDHLAFYHRETNQIWSGDVLFRQSIGRTDLPGGDFETLKHSIQKILYALPDQTIVHPGHGPETTIGFEKRANSFVKEDKS